mmetsp:Transcript_22688/g.51195  ORF Transcript_22688/g.51195 Transcript_22688/m.51195 type:complete len:246 (+) Transcript_22688:34-771(+)
MAKKTQSMADFVVPGKLLGRAEDVCAGAGTRENAGYVFAAVAGRVTRVPGGGEDGSLETVSVAHFKRPLNHHGAEAAGSGLPGIPRVGEVVLGRVVRITAQMVNVSVICVGESVLRQPCGGCIRVEDVFPGDVDHSAVQMPNCFRPGDVVRARIIAMGDSRAYFLTTAEVDLGVIWTRGPAHEVMVPVAWDQVASPESGATQTRKAAKLSEALLKTLAADSEGEDSPDSDEAESESESTGKKPKR